MAQAACLSGQCRKKTATRTFKKWRAERAAGHAPYRVEVKHEVHLSETNVENSCECSKIGELSVDLSSERRAPMLRNAAVVSDLVAECSILKWVM